MRLRAGTTTFWMLARRPFRLSPHRYADDISGCSPRRGRTRCPRVARVTRRERSNASKMCSGKTVHCSTRVSRTWPHRHQAVELHGHRLQCLRAAGPTRRVRWSNPIIRPVVPMPLRTRSAETPTGVFAVEADGKRVQLTLGLEPGGRRYRLTGNGVSHDGSKTPSRTGRTTLGTVAIRSCPTVSFRAGVSCRCSTIAPIAL